MVKWLKEKEKYAHIPRDSNRNDMSRNVPTLSMSAYDLF